MAQPTVILLQLPNGDEVFLNQLPNTTLNGGINCLTYSQDVKDPATGKLMRYVVLIPEPAVEEWEVQP